MLTGTLTEIILSEFYALQIDAPNQHFLSAKKREISVTIDYPCHAYLTKIIHTFLRGLVLMDYDCLELIDGPVQSSTGTGDIRLFTPPLIISRKLKSK